MARGCQELFTDPPFLLKFFELIFILLVVITYTVTFNYAVLGDWAYQVGLAFYFGILSSFYPVFVMFVIDIIEGFPDTMYEMVVAVFGGFSALMTGIFFIVTEYDRGHSNAGYKSHGYEGTDTSGGHSSTETDFLLIAIFSFILFIIFLVDAILSGLKGGGGE